MARSNRSAAAPAVAAIPAAVALAIVPDAPAPVAIVASDAALAAARGKTERLAILRAIEEAHGKVRESMLNGLRMTVNHGVTSPAEVTEGWPSCNNPGVYAPNFNRGHKSAQVIGIAFSLELIALAAAQPGTAYDNAKAALKVIATEGADRKKAGKTGMVVGQEARDLMDRALAANVKAEPVAAEGGEGGGGDGDEPGGTEPVAADTCASLNAELVALLVRYSKLAAPEGKEKVWAEGLDTVRDGAEQLQTCTRKSNAK